MTVRRGPTASGPPGSIRIIGGRWKRRLLPVVDAPGLRPTPARVRETLFNWIEHAFGGDLDGKRVLDLFAGSGALGLEAASRGAGPVTLVEANPCVARSLVATRDALRASDVVIRCEDALTVARSAQRTELRFDLLLLDPPFGEALLADALPLAAKLCDVGGLVYVESAQRLTGATVESLGLELFRADKAGEVFYHLLRRNI